MTFENNTEPKNKEKDRIIGGCYKGGEIICELRETDPEPDIDNFVNPEEEIIE